MNYWVTAHTSIRGRSHIEKNQPCQDKTFSVTSNDTTVIALSDGGGAYQHADIGAEIIVQAICEELVTNFNKLYQNEISGINASIRGLIQKSLTQKAKELGIHHKDLSGTLLFVATNKNRYLAGHIGDGIIGLLNQEKVQLLSKPDNGEFINLTYFINSDNAKKHLRIYKGNVNNINGFILMSDGSTASLFDKKREILSNACKKFFSWLDQNPQEEVTIALANNIKHFLIRRTTDDCSINLMKLKKDKSILPVKTLIFNEGVLNIELSIEKQYCDNANCKFHKLKGKKNIKIFSKRNYQVYCNNCKTKMSLTKNSFFANMRKKELYSILNIFYRLSKTDSIELVCKKFKFNRQKILKLLFKSLDYMEEIKQTLRSNFEVTNEELDKLENIIKTI